jgi:hypothetical protein
MDQGESGLWVFLTARTSTLITEYGGLMSEETESNEHSGALDCHPSSKRAERRHHQRRLKKKRREYWGAAHTDDARVTGKKYAAPKPQSTCMCCMNARAIEGLTRQEQRVKLEEQIDDLTAEDSFVCSRCGTFTWEHDRSGDTTECAYCY